jgi:CheY-like chemotaxis protein
MRGVGDILVVDDDEGVRGLIVDVLSAEGFAVREAENGQHALELLRSAPLPSLIVLDLKMPVLDGYGLLRIRAAEGDLRSVPVVVLTASEGFFRRQDVHAVVTKPFDPKRLIDEVRGALRTVQTHPVA